jgi:hypothetical protein
MEAIKLGVKAIKKTKVSNYKKNICCRFIYNLFKSQDLEKDPEFPKEVKMSFQLSLEDHIREAARKVAAETTAKVAAKVAAETSKKIARKMLQMKLAIPQIVEATGLSGDEVKSLKPGNGAKRPASSRRKP